MKIVILMGFAGSGKSFYTKTLKGKVKVVSSDHYFTDASGNYNWTPATARLGHHDCLKKFIHTIINSDDWYDYLVVDNTNLRITDITTYIRIAQAYQYDISVVYIDTDIKISKSRNVHNVPEFAYDKMQQDFETLISLWPKDFPNLEYVKT